MSRGCRAYHTIELTKGYHAKVDWEDACLDNLLWCVREQERGGEIKAYARRSRTVAEGPGPTSAHLHVEVAKRMGLIIPPGSVVDHRDGDGLNCRRSNLRAATVSENRRNVSGARKGSRSGILGVTQMPNGKWRSYIRGEGGKLIHLGVFLTAAEAEAARLIKEEQLWGMHPRRKAVT